MVKQRLFQMNLSAVIQESLRCRVDELISGIKRSVSSLVVGALVNELVLLLHVALDHQLGRVGPVQVDGFTVFDDHLLY